MTFQQHLKHKIWFDYFLLEIWLSVHFQDTAILWYSRNTTWQSHWRGGGGVSSPCIILRSLKRQFLTLCTLGTQESLLEHLCCTNYPSRCQGNIYQYLRYQLLVRSITQFGFKLTQASNTIPPVKVITLPYIFPNHGSFHLHTHTTTIWHWKLNEYQTDLSLIFILQIQNSSSSETMARMAQVPKKGTQNSSAPTESDLLQAGLVFMCTVSGIHSLLPFPTPITFFQAFLFTHILLLPMWAGVRSVYNADLFM